MVKSALLIGINYKNTPDELYGCINDVNNVRNFLVSKLGYENFIILTDDTRIKPTKLNILKAIEIFVRSLKPGDEAWFHYSGHGILQYDFNRDEESGYDSCIAPIDYGTSGIITDDTIRSILTRRVPKGAKLYMVLDACHSGTGCDNRYKYDDSSSFIKDKNVVPTTYNHEEWELGRRTRELKYQKTAGDVFCMSGCQDDQESADAFIEKDQLFGGALTSTLLFHLNSNDLNTYKWKHCLKDVCCTLRVHGYVQQATLTSGQPINMESSVFELQRKLKKKKEINNFNTFIDPNKNKNMNRMNMNYSNNFLFRF